jgi:outer membrane protein assembly factor BamB
MVEAELVMRPRRLSHKGATVVLLLVAATALLAGCGSSSKKTSTTSSTSGSQTADHSVATTWSLPNANLWDNRTVASQVNASNVSKLNVLWTLPINAKGFFGGFSSTPVFDNGVVYLQDIGSNVIAVDEKTGKVKWKYTVPKAENSGEGPNGVAIVNGVVYGASKTTAFALRASTGEAIWKDTGLAQKNGQGFNMAPLVTNGVEYISTSGQSHGGVAYAMTASTGKILWKFQETKYPTERALGATNGTGGAWGTPLLIGNSIYLGIANPYRSINDALNKATRLPYNDSTVSLNAQTGALQWVYQAVPNDFHDWDMQIGPMYAPNGPGGQPTVIDAGKMGVVFAYNAKTGKLLWKTPVGYHNGKDNDPELALAGKLKKPKLPYTYCPGVLGGVETQMAMADGVVFVPVNNLCSKFTGYNQGIAGLSFAGATGAMEALDLKTGRVLWNAALPASPYGSATVTNDLVFTTTFDGKAIAFNKDTGQQVWSKQLPAGTNSALSIDGDTVIVPAGYASGAGQKEEIVAYSLHAPAQSSTTSGGSTTTKNAGSPVSVSVAAGAKLFVSNCSTCHTMSEVGTHGKVGPNLDTLKPTDAVVQRQVTNGGGGMPAFGKQLSKSQIKAVALFVSSIAGTGKKVKVVGAKPNVTP